MRAVTQSVRRLCSSSGLHYSSCTNRCKSLSFVDRRRFASNTDNDKEPLVPSKNRAVEKMTELKKSFDTTIERNKHASLWSMLAWDDDHKQWIDEYSKVVAKYQQQHTGQHFTFKCFKEMSKWMGYLGSVAVDSLQRMRMRPLKPTMLCYEEFMVGALHSFVALRSMDQSNAKRMSHCLGETMASQMAEIKDGLFDIQDGTYDLKHIEPLASTLYFQEKAHEQKQESDVPDAEMHFNIRYYYTLSNANDALDVRHKCASVEWIGLFEPQLSDGKFERLNLSSKGFQIDGIEIESL